MSERGLIARIGFLWLAAILLVLTTCSKNNDPVKPPALDGTPPAAITDLAAVDPTMSSVALTWTAPGNDGSTGTAARYDIRYSPAPITAGNWPSAHNVSGIPSPKQAGGAESFEITGLGATIRYYFALKTADERPNWSPISNPADATTLAVTSGWSAMGSGMSFEPYGPSVLALAVYNGSLVAGGWFTSAGNVTVNMLAVWDGGAWSDLGSGRGNTIGLNAFATYNGRLITGSDIDSYSQMPLWAWDGSSWTSLPGLRYNNVLALTTYGSLLIAGGIIEGVGGVPGGSVAAWDGSVWSALGTGITPRFSTISYVYALGSYNGRLIAGGDFTNAGGNLANGIAAWNGSAWSPLGSGVNGSNPAAVFALAVYDNKLIVGGIFTDAGGTACSNIAAWDGSSWSTLGLGMSGGTYPPVSALAVYNNRLIAGGLFTHAGGVPCNNIARWDGSSWSPLGSGVDAQVRSLAVYNGRLIVGGDFTSAGGYPAASIASWTE